MGSGFVTNSAYTEGCLYANLRGIYLNGFKLVGEAESSCSLLNLFLELGLWLFKILSTGTLTDLADTFLEGG